MTQQIINLGVADKGNGDVLRTAFGKVNANFAELYNQIATSVVVGATAPTGPEEGALWWNSESGRMYVYYGTSWVDASPVDGAGISSTNQLINGAYTTSLGANGVLTLPDGSIINGSTIRGVAGTGELNYTGITIGPNSNDAEKTWMWVDHENAYITTNNAANTWTFGTDGSLTFPDTLSIKDSVIGKTGTNTITEGEASQTTAIESQIEITATGVVIAKRTSVTVNDGVITTVNNNGSTLELDNTHAALKYYQEPDGPDNNQYIQFTTDSNGGGGATIEIVTEDVGGIAHGRVRAAGDSVFVSAKTFLGTDQTWRFNGAGNLQLPDGGDITSDGIDYTESAYLETSYNDAEGAYQDALTDWMTSEMFKPVWFALPGRLAYNEMIAWIPTAGQPTLPLILPPVAKNAQDIYAGWQATVALSKLTLASGPAEFDFNSTGKLRLPQGGTVGGGDPAAIQAAYDDWQADEADWQNLITEGGTNLNVRPWTFAGPSRAEKQAVVLSMWQAQQSGAAIDWVPISSTFYNQVRAWLAITANQDGYENWKKLTTSVNITSDDKTWTFGNNGTTTFPGDIVDSEGVSVFVDTPDNKWIVDPSNTATYTADGSVHKPFKTITATLAHIEVLIAAGQLTQFDETANIVLSPQFIVLTSSTTENVNLTRGHIYIVGDTPDAGHVPIWIQGHVTITPGGATKAANDFGLFHVAVLPTGNFHGVKVTGTAACRVYLEDVYVYQGTAGYSCVYQDNSDATTKLEMVDCHTSREGGSTYLVDIQSAYCLIHNLETNGVGQALNFANASTGTMLNSVIDAGVGAVITLSGTVQFGMGNCILNNTSAATNSYGVNMSGTASMQFGVCTFNIPAAQATNRAINGTATNTVLYTGVVFQYGTCDKISTAIPLIPLATAFTAV